MIKLKKTISFCLASVMACGLAFGTGFQTVKADAADAYYTSLSEVSTFTINVEAQEEDGSENTARNKYFTSTAKLEVSEGSLVAYVSASERELFFDVDGYYDNDIVSEEDGVTTYKLNLSDPTLAERITFTFNVSGINPNFASGNVPIVYLAFSANSSTLTQIQGVYDGTIVPGDVTAPELNKEDTNAYISGYEDGTVRPEGQMTREAAAQMFYNLLTEESREYYYSTSNSFTDATSDWSNEAISTLSKAGIINGYSASTFEPEKTITRSELIKMVVGFTNIADTAFDDTYTSTPTFSDVASDHWARFIIAFAEENGLVGGYEDGTFHPDANVTRAEAVKIMNAALGRSTDDISKISDMKTWPDNSDTSTWYYKDIQIATNSY
ncbi:MAG: S-layer homology domain-containing protein [Sporomusa sp.]